MIKSSVILTPFFRVCLIFTACIMKNILSPKRWTNQSSNFQFCKSGVRFVVWIGWDLVRFQLFEHVFLHVDPATCLCHPPKKKTNIAKENKFGCSPNNCNRMSNLVTVCPLWNRLCQSAHWYPKLNFARTQPRQTWREKNNSQKNVFCDDLFHRNVFFIVFPHQIHYRINQSFVHHPFLSSIHL